MARMLRGDVVALDDGGGGAEIFDAAVGAGAEEDGVDRDVVDRRAGFEAHVFEGALEGLAVGFVGGVGGVGDGGVDGGDHAGAGAPADVGDERGGIDGEFAIELCAGVGGELAPLGDGVVPGFRP